MKKRDRIQSESHTRLTNACAPCEQCGMPPLIRIVMVDGEVQYKFFCSSHQPHNSAGQWYKAKARAALDWNKRQKALRWNPKRNLGERLQPCPFCGRHMVFYREECTNSEGKSYVQQHFMHEGVDGSKRTDCVLEEMDAPFVIPAGDARPDDGYIGEYAELWNKRTRKI